MCRLYATGRFLQDLEDKRRDEEEERERKKDDLKIKKMMKQNLPQQILAVNAQNDPLPIRRRCALRRMTSCCVPGAAVVQGSTDQGYIEEMYRDGLF